MTTPAYTLVHDDQAGRAEEACIPRISLDCARCKASTVYCHVARATIRTYVDPPAPAWVCAACEAQP